MTSLFCCPVCGAPLEREERVYRCPGGHNHFPFYFSFHSKPHFCPHFLYPQHDLII